MIYKLKANLFIVLSSSDSSDFQEQWVLKNELLWVSSKSQKEKDPDFENSDQETGDYI